jgi:HK97 family phage portal protein
MFKMFRKKEEVRSYSAATVGSYFDDLTSGDAMNIPAVYSAVSMISNAVASAKMENSPLGREPQSNMSLFTWTNTIVKNVLLHGNAFAKIEAKGVYRLLDPKNVSMFYDKDYFNIVYYQHGTEKIYPEDMLHFKNLSKDNLGQIGYSALTNFSNSFSRVKAMSEYEGNYMINASRPSLWLSTLKNLNKDTLTQLKESFKAAYQGTKNSGAVPVLSDGMELHELSATNTLVDADLVQLKQASLKEISNIFLLPVSMMDNSLSNYGNAVEANLQFLKMTIQPLLNSIREEVNLKLSSNMSFDTSAFIEGSFEQKINTLTSAVAGGILTPNEARQRLNYKDIKDNDKLFAPAGTPTPGEA